MTSEADTFLSVEVNMKRAVVILVLLGLWCGGSGLAQTPKNGARWEYAEFTFGATMTSFSVIWTAGDSLVTVMKDQQQGRPDVIRMFGLRENPKALVQAVLNALGEQGWELVTVLGPPPSGGSKTYYFKRRI